MAQRLPPFLFFSVSFCFPLVRVALQLQALRKSVLTGTAPVCVASRSLIVDGDGDNNSACLCLSLSHTHSLPLPLSLSLARTRSLSHTHARAHTHTHTDHGGAARRAPPRLRRPRFGHVIGHVIGYVMGHVLSGKGRAPRVECERLTCQITAL